MELKFVKTRLVNLPTTAHPEDAGIDFYLPDDLIKTDIKKSGPNSIILPSGLKVIIPQGYYLKIHNKSGISTKYNCTIGACIVDCGYTGEIFFHLINVSKNSIKPGIKIVQATLEKINSCKILEATESDFIIYEMDSKRKNRCLGSTD